MLKSRPEIAEKVDAMLSKNKWDTKGYNDKFGYVTLFQGLMSTPFSMLSWTMTNHIIPRKKRYIACPTFTLDRINHRVLV